MIWMEDLLLAFGGSEQTIPYAKDYLNIVHYRNDPDFAQLWFQRCHACIRLSEEGHVYHADRSDSQRDTRPDFYLLAGYGYPGAAIATIISMLLSTLFVMNHFIQKDSIVRFHKGTFKLERHVVWNILTIGVSPFAMQLAGSLVVVIQNYALKQYGGDLALESNGIITSVGMLLVMLIIGIAQGMQPIVGFNYGVGQHKRVQDTLWLVIITSTVIMGIGCLCSVLFPEIIARAFTNDPELIEVTANGLRISLLVFVVVGSADFHQPVFPEYRYCLESDVSESEPSVSFPDSCPFDIPACVGDWTGCGTLRRFQTSLRP